MRLFSENLLDQLAKKLLSAQAADIAAAYISDSDPLQELVSFAKRVGRNKVRVIAGINGFTTSPAALRTLQSVSRLHVVGRTKGPNFHPKLYIFKSDKLTTCWIGSANLTESGFRSNTEILCEFEDEGAQAFFDRWWMIGGPPDELWLQKYEKGYVKKRSLQDLNDPADDLGAPPPVLLDVEGWQHYVTMLLEIDEARTHRIIDLIDAASNLLVGNWDDLREKRNLILGMHAYAELGNLGSATTAKRIFGDDPIFLDTRYSIKEALSKLKDAKTEVYSPVFDDLVRLTWVKLTSISGIGTSIASRLLTLVRPDVCVSLNEKSENFYARELHRTVPYLETAEGYVDLCRWVRRQSWWNSPQPSDALHKRLWDARAALQDIPVYAHWLRQEAKLV